jgi:hypothetical protein
MKKRFKGIEIFLVITISFFVLAFSAYLRCAQLSQTKFGPSDLSFANPNQEEGLPATEKEGKGYGLSTMLMMSLWGRHLFGPSSHSFPRFLSLRQKSYVLRC